MCFKLGVALTVSINLWRPPLPKAATYSTVQFIQNISPETTINGTNKRFILKFLWVSHNSPDSVQNSGVNSIYCKLAGILFSYSCHLKLYYGASHSLFCQNRTISAIPKAKLIRTRVIFLSFANETRHLLTQITVCVK